MKKFITLLMQRWKADTPRFFKGVVRVGLSISAVSVAIHVAVVGAGATEPNWWCVVYPYVVGIPTGMAAVAKFAKEDKE